MFINIYIEDIPRKSGWKPKDTVKAENGGICCLKDK